MKTIRLLLPLASFAAAILAARFWPHASGAAESENTDASALGSILTKKPETTPGKTIRQAPETSPSAAPPGPNSATPPGMEEVFAATGLDRMLLMARFIQTASVEELKEVIDRTVADGNNEPILTNQAWLRWVELDLEGALQHKRPSNAWWAYAKLDPPAALARALKSQPSILAEVLSSIGQNDPALARRVLAEHPEADDPFYASLVLSGVMKGLAKNDPAAATALALEKDGDNLDGHFNQWLDCEPEKALAWMRGLSNPAIRRSLEDLAMTQAIVRDPAAGLEQARQLPPGRSQATHTVEAITALSRQDPAAAQAAAEALPSTHTQQLALAALAGSLASSDPTAAAALVTSLDWELLNRSYPSQWAYRSIDNPSARGGHTGHTGHTGYTGQAAAETTLTQLMSAAPQVTLDALATLATTSEPPSGPFDRWVPLAKAVQKWAAMEPEAASGWLKNQPPGAARDLGIEGLSDWLISGSAEPDYAAALAWAGAASEERQFQFYEKTLSAWKRKDPKGAAATAAVDTLPISTETRNRLLKVINPTNDDPFAK